MNNKNPLIFLKLGGSLITDKNRKNTARPDILERIAREIKQARVESLSLRIIIGHGSGSFGHWAGRKYATREGVHTQEQWRGFVEVWESARELNQIVVKTLLAASLPVLAFPPSASVISENRRIISWDVSAMQNALMRGIIPVVAGDVVFDKLLGGTILSTEELFQYLARQFQPGHILLSGIEEGVWADFPACNELIPKITDINYGKVRKVLTGSASVDVTGGMSEKVATMLTLAREIPGLMISIFSGNRPDNIYHGLLGVPQGTQITND